MKLLESNTRENLCKFWVGKEFSDRAQQTQTIKKKSDKLDFIKIKNIYSLKDTILGC